MKVVVLSHRDHFRFALQLVEVFGVAGHEAMAWDDADFAAQRSRAQDAFMFGLWDTKFSRMAAATVPQRIRGQGLVSGFNRRLALVLPVDDIVDRDTNLKDLDTQLEELDQASANKAMMVGANPRDSLGVVFCRSWIDRVRRLAAQRNPRTLRFDMRYVDAQIALGVARFLADLVDEWMAQPGITPPPVQARSGTPVSSTATPFVSYAETLTRNPTASVPPTPRVAEVGFRATTRDGLQVQLQSALVEVQSAEGRVSVREDAVRRAAPADRDARSRELDNARRLLRIAHTRVSALTRQLES